VHANLRKLNELAFPSYRAAVLIIEHGCRFESYCEALRPYDHHGSAIRQPDPYRVDRCVIVGF